MIKKVNTVVLVYTKTYWNHEGYIRTDKTNLWFFFHIPFSKRRAKNRTVRELPNLVRLFRPQEPYISCPWFFVSPFFRMTSWHGPKKSTKNHDYLTSRIKKKQKKNRQISTATCLRLTSASEAKSECVRAHRLRLCSVSTGKHFFLDTIL